MYRRDVKLHFVGIGGVGMAGIAEVLVNLGYQVSGSDMKRSALCEHLLALGVEVSFEHSADLVTDEVGAVVVSSAVRPNNPEVLAAQKKGIPVIPRAEMLAELMRMKYGIAVAGSHGKTTTTSMVDRVLTAGGLDPTVIVGGRVLSKRSGASVGKGPFLVAEADESDGSFRMLRPAISVVTNIDVEHLSHYGTFGALEEAFFRFIEAVPFYGAAVLCFDDPVVAKLGSNLKRRVISYGRAPENDFVASDILVKDGCSTYTLQMFGEECCRVTLPVPGAHMVLNSLAAIAVGYELGVSIEQSVAALEEFPGVARRSEVVFQSNELTIIDDYGHHPTEISATLKAIREAYIPANGSGRLIALFQPHRYSRTKELFSEFVEAFSDADEVVMESIYAAGEEPLDGITAEKLCKALHHEKASFVERLEKDVDGISKMIAEGDVVVTLGAGDVSNVARLLADRRRNS